MTEPSDSDRLSSARLTSFVSLEIPMAAFLMPLVVFVPALYAGELGLGLGLVGSIFGLTKLWDIFTDPILGSAMDRFGPPANRRRFWLALSIPVMVVGIYRVFLPPANVDGAYFAVWMMFLYVGWTVFQISHISWGVEISTDYHERARIAAYRQLATLVGSVVVIFIPVVMDSLGHTQDSDRVNAIGYFLMASIPLLAPLVFWSHKEKSSHDDSTHPIPRTSPMEIFKLFRSNASFRALIAGNMAMLIGISATASTLLFYVESVLRLREWATLAIVPLLFSGILFLPAWRILCRRIGKQKTFRVSLILQTALLPIFLIIPPENLLLTVFAFVLLGANHGTVNFLPQAMIADLTDADVQNGYRRRTGLYVSLLQSTSKLSAALAVAVMFLALPLTGFNPDPDANNTESSLTGLRVMIAVLPGCFYVMGWFAMRNYTLGDPQEDKTAATLTNSGPSAAS